MLSSYEGFRSLKHQERPQKMKEYVCMTHLRLPVNRFYWNNELLEEGVGEEGNKGGVWKPVGYRKHSVWSLR